MANKLVAVFLMCIVVMATMHVAKAEATSEDYRKCYETCQKECMDKGKGYTFCEMKCDTDCSVKELKARLESLKPIKP